MYEIDKECLEKIITNAKFVLDEGENRIIRDTLNAVISGLCTYTTEVNKSIVQGIIGQDRTVQIQEIIVAILQNEDDKEKELWGLCAMAEKSEKRIFLNEGYERIKSIVGDDGNRKFFEGEYCKDGQTEKFQYYLKFDRSFVKKQEMIYRVADFYKISNPVVYSPFSHKSFYVIYDRELDKENVKLDFRFRENGLNVILDKQLYWNIKETTIENKTYDAKLPYGNETRYVFKFSKNKKGKYLLALPTNNQTKVYDIKFDEFGSEIVIDHDMDDFLILEILDVDKSSSTVKALKSNKMFFTNLIDYTGPITSRLVSKGDIEHAIAPFRNTMGVKCEISDGTNTIVGRYASKYRANRYSRIFFHVIRREYILFISDNSDCYINDYINYVIDYLEYHYPEIEWVGER